MFIIQNKFTKDFIDENGDWTMIRSLAKRFPSKEAIMKWIKSDDYKGSVLHCEPEFLKIVKEETKMKSFKEHFENNKLSESFPAAPSIKGAFDDDEKYNKYTKDINEWQSKCQDKCNTLVAKIRRMAERFGADILDSVRNSLSNEQRTEALNELERIYNDLDRLMDKTKIKKN